MSFSDRHLPGMPFTIGEICCSALGVIPIHTFTYVKKDREVSFPFTLPKGNYIINLLSIFLVDVLCFCYIQKYP